VDELGEAGDPAAQHAAALEMARKTAEAAGGFPEERARIDAVRATSADRSVLQLLDYMREHTMLTHGHIPDHLAGMSIKKLLLPYILVSGGGHGGCLGARLGLGGQDSGSR
jgi:hypothetical protein